MNFFINGLGFLKDILELKLGIKKQIPSFSLHNNYSEFFVECDDYNKKLLVVKILLTNLTKSTATDFKLEVYDKPRRKFFKFRRKEPNRHLIYDNLDYNFCLSGCSMYIYVYTDITEIDLSGIKDYFYFKLTFRNEKGDIYSQEFKVGYEHRTNHFVFTDDCSVGPVRLVKRNLRI